MGRLIFTKEAGNNENKFIVGSTVGRQSKFVRSALNRRASNNSQGLCCDSKNASDVPESLPAPAVPAASEERFMVTVRDYNGNNKYFIDGKRQPSLTFNRGFTYKFDQSDPSNVLHQLKFSNIANGIWAGGSPYTDGVTTIGTPGTLGASTSIIVGDNTPSPLFYYCGKHPLMGGNEIRILPI